MTGDDELFAELQSLVARPQRQPPPESVAALHAAVARKFPSRAKRPWRQKVIAGAAVFSLVAGGPAAAFGLSGAPLPDPLRTAMHAIGLPVDSVPVAGTKESEGDLAHALQDRNHAAITKAADHLEGCLAELDPADRARLGPRADSLLWVAGMLGGSDDHQGVSDGSSSTEHSTDGPINTVDGESGSGDSIPSSPNATVEGGSATGFTGSGTEGDHTTTTAVAPAQSQTDGGTDTVTTVQSSGSDGGSGSTTSDGGDSTTTTTVDQSH